MSSSPKQIERWLNIYQNAVLLAKPRKLKVRAGRRGGKTEEILAERSLLCMTKLPGSSGFFAGASLSKLLDHLLPGIIAGWQKRGWVEDEDYVIAKAPPKGFKRPFMPPKKYDHYISAKIGSGAHLISMDHSVTSNGITTDWGAIDEFKQIKPEKANLELFKTLSGHHSIKLNKNTCWGNLPEHRMITLLSDKYIGPKDYQWKDDYESEALSDLQLYKLMRLAERVQDTKNPYLQRELWEQQCKATVCLEYSSRASLPVIGIDYFKDQFKNSTAIEFRTSILNENVKEIDGGFYTFLDEELHTYEARNNSRIDTIGISDYMHGRNKNCLLDKDWRKELPLKLSVDYGSDHSWFVVAQKYANTYWLLNNYWTNPGQTFLDGADWFCNYYRPHEKKVIELYDDPGGHKKNPEQKRDVDKMITRLKANGWVVKHMNPGNQYVPHRYKYRIWQLVLDERKEKRNPKAPYFKLNINNAFQSFYSMSKAPLKLSQTDGYQKDKASEKKLQLDQWKATHLSDAVDNIICYDNLHLVDGKGEWLGV